MSRYDNERIRVNLGWHRRHLAAFLREAIKQARKDSGKVYWDELEAIADNLHSPPPSPTLAQAREADLDTPAGRDVVRDFLASIPETVQP